MYLSSLEKHGQFLFSPDVPHLLPIKKTDGILAAKLGLQSQYRLEFHKSIILPAGSRPEMVANKTGCSSYAVFATSFLNAIAKNLMHPLVRVAGQQSVISLLCSLHDDALALITSGFFRPLHDWQPIVSG